MEKTRLGKPVYSGYLGDRTSVVAILGCLMWAGPVLAGGMLSLRPATNFKLVHFEEEEEPLSEDVDGGESESTETEETSTIPVSSRHPEWVLRAEEAMWPGFLTGMSGFDDFIMPVGMPIYFEDPFITTDLRLLYIYHGIPGGSVLRGGEIHVAAAQVRIALTEDLALIATKDGYSWVDTGITRQDDGFNDWALGLKYNFYDDPDEQFALSGGMRWETSNGHAGVFQGGAQELSPFISFAKGWDKLHFLGAVSGRFPTNRNLGTYSLIWNVHLDYQLTETFYPLIEFHGIHWFSDGGLLPISTDYLDVGSVGAAANGEDFYSCGIGFRWEVLENVSVGLTWEFPLRSVDDHIQENRLTFNTVVSF